MVVSENYLVEDKFIQVIFILILALLPKENGIMKCHIGDVELVELIE